MQRTKPRVEDIAEYAPNNYDWGKTLNKETIHLVDFDTDNPLQIKAKFPDRTYCGQACHAVWQPTPESRTKVCEVCTKKALADTGFWV